MVTQAVHHELTLTPASPATRWTDFGWEGRCDCGDWESGPLKGSKKSVIRGYYMHKEEATARESA